MIFKNKKGAMEMSIGTIVTIVLSMTLLIGGIVLVRNIINSSNDVVDMTDAQLKNQINQLFGSDSKVVMFPDSREIKAKIGDDIAFAFGIKNLLVGIAGQNAEFQYEVNVADSGNCGIGNSIILDWIILGKSGTVTIPQGETYSSKVRMSIPDGSPLCSFRLSINVKSNDKNYYTDYMDVKIAS